MPININYYVNIVSGVAAGVNIGTRQLIPMIFVDNPLIPSGSFVNFPNNRDAAANVAEYFGSDSEEYKRALFALGWISKLITVVPSISYARYNAVACAPKIYGDPNTTETALASWTGITTGAFTLTMGAFTDTLSGLDFSSAASLGDVADVIQTAIQAYVAGGALWTAATVTYDATRGSFIITGGATGTAPVSVVAGTGGNDVAAALGLLSVETILGPGAPAQTPSEALSAINVLNNNFGSFLFMDDLTTDEIKDLAATNYALNNVYMYAVPVTTANASTIQASIGGVGGCTVTLVDDPNTQYDEMMPMLVLGATDYTRTNATQNYMFQTFDGVDPKVESTTTAEAYDTLFVNYYANTQESGQTVNLYQRGVMNGGAQDALYQNTYANEIWLKAALTASLMTLLLNVTKISANSAGRAQVLNNMQSIINLARANGTISVSRPLTSTQISLVTQFTNDPLAYRQVQNLGYWVDAVISSTVVDGRTRYSIDYTLVYAQDNVVSKINGSDILI